MRQLSSNFSYNKYGYSVRLVNESDADFVVRLRTRPEANGFLHSTSNRVEDQKLWIEEYKRRESEGLEYYFVYEKNNEPFGINRIYDIRNGEGTTGSWICSPNTNPIDTLATAVLLYDIAFDEIGLSIAHFNTNKDNTSALKVNRAIGGKLVSANDTDYFFDLKQEVYHSLHERLLRIWHLKY